MTASTFHRKVRVQNFKNNLTALRNIDKLVKPPQKLHTKIVLHITLTVMLKERTREEGMCEIFAGTLIMTVFS